MNALQPIRPHARRARRADDARKPVMLSPLGLRQVQRYLLPSERPVVVTRKHWFLIAEPIFTGFCALALAVLAVTFVGDSFAFLVDLALLGTVLAFGRAAWKVIEWRTDWFIVTDERLLSTYGLLTRRVAVMPLSKVTDLSYNVPLLGRILRYGEFVFESAGQDQALHTVDYLSHSRHLFGVLSEELFGEQGVATTRKLLPSRRSTD
jgi:hypothetical protein